MPSTATVPIAPELAPSVPLLLTTAPPFSIVKVPVPEKQPTQSR
ncbi:hypothetical protein [Bradyrhizobium sp. NAS80.1]|nr:hypothetical protein [Bradyrhizobium sp. NAS80.1]